MKPLFLCILTLLLNALVASAQLTANAGGTLIWCHDTDIYGPQIGGNPSASKGTPPYTY